MTVHIKFEPDEESGVVAEGTLLWDAARRLGVQIPVECKGLGECDTCSVIVQGGAALLSSPTSAELEQLSADRLAGNERLACQARVVQSGELILMRVPKTKHVETPEEAAAKFRQEFRELPLGRKLTKLVEFEAVTAFETLTTLSSLPFTVGEKVLDKIAEFGRKKKKRVSFSQEEPAAQSETKAKPDKDSLE